MTLFHCKLLPKSLVEVEDFVDPKGWVSIVRKKAAKTQAQKAETGLLSSIVFYFGGSGSDAKEARPLTAEEQELLNV